MTVKHLQQIQRQQLATAVATDPAVVMRFKSGFDECAAEVSRYIGRLDGVDSRVKQRLTAHLHRCVNSLQQMNTFPQQNVFSSLAQNCDKSTIVLPSVSALPGDVNNNSNQGGQRIQIPSGLQLIPSRLPTGELALLVPNSNQMSTFLNAPQGVGNFQFHSSPNMSGSSIVSPTFGNSLNTSPNHASAFTAVTKNQEHPSPTTTMDSKSAEAMFVLDNHTVSTSHRGSGSGSASGGASGGGGAIPSSSQVYIPRTFKSTENDHLVRTNGEVKDCAESNEEQNVKKPSLLQISNCSTEIPQKYQYGKFKNFIYNNKFNSDFDGNDRKVSLMKSQVAVSTSTFQRNAADSTTSFVQTKENVENCFKPFHVEIPNSQLKAHISMPESLDQNRYKSSTYIHQKPNPNFTLNPNRPIQKSPHKYTRQSDANSESQLSEGFPNGKYDGFEKFSKIEPLSIITTNEKGTETGDFAMKEEVMEYSVPLIKRPRSTETFHNFYETSMKKNSPMFSMSSSPSPKGALKRPLSTGSTDAGSPTSSESPNKTPRISLNVTLTEGFAKEGFAKEGSANQMNDRCQRISVIVEDVSKSNGREANNDGAVPNQRDMWRPW